ncbi:hypothetical protein [Lentilactobacillus senioris]|uniref:hypothetical protein n=1 Tax=Lentilactobacillus senioris TaxID=931534 RepID=UPI003D29D461
MYIQIVSDTEEDCWLRIDNIFNFCGYSGFAVYLPSGDEKYKIVKNSEIIGNDYYKWNDILDRYEV